jgi:hypothetical protein
VSDGNKRAVREPAGLTRGGFALCNTRKVHGQSARRRSRGKIVQQKVEYVACRVGPIDCKKVVLSSELVGELREEIKKKRTNTTQMGAIKKSSVAMVRGFPRPYLINVNTL